MWCVRESFAAIRDECRVHVRLPVTRMPRIENVLRPSERARGTHIDTVTGEEMGCNRPPGTTVCHGELLVNDLVESRDAFGRGLLRRRASLLCGLAAGRLRDGRPGRARLRAGNGES